MSCARRLQPVATLGIVEGACTFLSLPRLTGVLASIPAGTTVTVEMLANYLDHAAHQAIDDWQRQHCATGGTVRITGTAPGAAVGQL